MRPVSAVATQPASGAGPRSDLLGARTVRPVSAVAPHPQSTDAAAAPTAPSAGAIAVPAAQPVGNAGSRAVPSADALAARTARPAGATAPIPQPAAAVAASTAPPAGAIAAPIPQSTGAVAASAARPAGAIAGPIPQSTGAVAASAARPAGAIAGPIPQSTGAVAASAARPAGAIAGPAGGLARDVAASTGQAAQAVGAAAGRPAGGAGSPDVRLGGDPEVQAALVARNATLAPFWLRPRDGLAADPALVGRRALVIDAEDTFTGMLVHQLRVLGLSTSLVRHDSHIDIGNVDLVIPGPGPGDPRRLDDPKMARMRGIIADRLDAGAPMLAVCLSHQLLAGLLGLPLRRKASPYQGMQRNIDLFGHPATVGFYSTFTATHAAAVLHSSYGPVDVARDPANGDVHALRGRTFASVQFHPESVLSQHGIDILRDLLTVLLDAPAITAPAPE
ncbi:aminodeoxychorismate/anthranilate synthase component II [Dactylosporangium sp. CA-092794]|uniref:aminodeoxychorismate/anthranilate synthase component II n=1 Tax=Dactylosporangium sp. CA-092794 TaxID=3239929 RepID=UPI003D8DBA68